MELQNALLTSRQGEIDWIIEIESSTDANATFHSKLRQFACQAADNALSLVSRLSISDYKLDGFFLVEICKMEYSLYRIQLCAPPTSTAVYYDPMSCYREGFIVVLSLEDGSVGFGQVTPLEIHEDNLIDVEEQLRFLIHAVQAAKISYLLPLLKGSFSSWIWNSLGILPGSIFPSVRCGLEMAILNAIAASEGSSLLNILHRETATQEELSERSSIVQICALIDSNGTPKDVVDIAAALVGEARRPDPIEDAMVIQEVRKKVGHQINLRADANWKWTYEEAVLFGSSVMNCGLQYIEVIKPSVVGGFENAALIARWAQQQGKMSAVSATFESSLGLSAYVQFSYYLDLQKEDICMAMNKQPSPSIAHGLGTYRWPKEDITAEPLNIHHNPCSGFIEASVDDAGCLLGNFQVDNKVILRNFTGEEVHKYQLTFNSYGFSFFINNNVLVFLHGFLGTGEDWILIMKAISGSARCIAADLPGHGRSKIQNHGMREALIQNITPGKVTLAGYSMRARIALYMALRCASKFEGAVIVSGSPGLKDVSARKIHKAKDDSRVCSLINHGLELFLDTWYAGELWNRPLWEDLRLCKVPLLLVVGEKDDKFRRIAKEMFHEFDCSARSMDDREESCGHAIHLENPLPLINAIRQLLKKSKLSLIPEPAWLFIDVLFSFQKRQTSY
ncbi:hypothetical protein LOK49_Contig138G00007 [Camellia lanceoleosa]|nr:hypothetical protein LOK49_Contig138G00007 [Camellia lanceoleosa]